MPLELDVYETNESEKFTHFRLSSSSATIIISQITLIDRKIISIALSVAPKSFIQIVILFKVLQNLAD